MKIIIYILLIIVPNFLFAQNYLDYYQGINNGKTSALNNNVEESMNSYFSTFEKFEFVFARDCYNAIELAVFNNDSLKADYFIKRGIKQGLKLNQILKIKNISKFQNSSFLNKISNEKDSLENFYTSSINWKLRNEIIKMFQDDQAIREKYYKAILFKRMRIGRKWEELNKEQVERLIEITKNYGFPGEKLIGIDTEKMHPKALNAKISAGMPILILIHHYSKPNKSYDSLLFEQIKTGNLYNEHFATICDFEAKFGKNKYETYGSFAFKHFPKIIDENEINSKRKEISLLSISEYKNLNSVKSITRFWNHLF